MSVTPEEREWRLFFMHHHNRLVAIIYNHNIFTAATGIDVEHNKQPVSLLLKCNEFHSRPFRHWNILIIHVYWIKHFKLHCSYICLCCHCYFSWNTICWSIFMHIQLYVKHFNWKIFKAKLFYLCICKWIFTICILIRYCWFYIIGLLELHFENL